MIYRDTSPELASAAARAGAIMLTGPRQSGKTTLCRILFPEHPYRTLEALDERALAAGDPLAYLAQFPDGAVIDEVHRVPGLISCLQGIIDNDPAPGRWILIGSQSLPLPEPAGRTSAGRCEAHRLLPLTWGEIRRFAKHPASLEGALFSGAWPGIFDRKADPSAWLDAYAAAWLERDVRTIVNVGDLATFQRFVELCAGRTAQLLNYSSLAGDCGISQPCAKAWLGILEACFIAFRLPAFETRTRKRLVKMPKLYFHDTGLACWLLGIREARQLRSHPLRGALFETWVVSETIKHRANRASTPDLSFYRDRNGAEADLIIERPAGLTLLDAKSSATPSDSLFSGVRRVRRHFPDAPPHDVAVAYGGEEYQQRSGGRLIPWRMLRQAALANADPVIRVFAGGRPLADAGILALFADNTWKRAKTAKDGEAALDLHSSHLPLTVFVAARGFAAHLERAWMPAERELHIALRPLRSGGAVLFAEAAGRVPGLAGQLNPVRNTQDSTYLYADRIAINGGRQQPVVFRPGEQMHLADAFGKELLIRIIEIAGSAALLEYRQPPPPGAGK